MMYHCGDRVLWFINFVFDLLYHMVTHNRMMLAENQNPVSLPCSDQFNIYSEQNHPLIHPLAPFFVVGAVLTQIFIL